MCRQGDHNFIKDRQHVISRGFTVLLIINICVKCGVISEVKYE